MLKNDYQNYKYSTAHWLFFCVNPILIQKSTIINGKNNIFQLKLNLLIQLQKSVFIW